MRGEQFYRKVGRRYYPVNDPGAYDGLPQGSWLVVVDKGCKSIRKVVEPDYVGFDAAARVAIDAACEAIREASKYKPSRKLTEKEQRAWEAYTAIAGDVHPLWLESASPQDVAEAAIEAVRKVYIERVSCSK